MPRVDGVGLLTHIKKNFPHINVCMVSGGSSYSEEDFLRLGACGYISKPYH